MYSAYSINVPDYKSALEILKERSETNSSQTSSLPLAAFWYPKRNENQKNKLFQGIGINNVDIFDSQNIEYNFEYPTPAYKDEKSGKIIEHSRSSMSDLMILLKDTEDTRITIEAKYTEYVEDPKYSPLLKHWYEKDNPNEKIQQDRTKILENRMKILNCWIKYINACGHNIPSADVLLDKYSELPYQFLHRTASACFNCKHPILVYQLFYDETQESIEKLKDFKNLLADWAEKLQLKLPFFIVETEVKGCPHPDIWNKKSKENHSDLLFCKMIDDENLYTFGKINILNGYKIPQH